MKISTQLTTVVVTKYKFLVVVFFVAIILMILKFP